MEFLEQNPLYVVAIIAVVIWLGIFLFLLSVDRRLKRVEAQTSGFSGNSGNLGPRTTV